MLQSTHEVSCINHKDLRTSCEVSRSGKDGILTGCKCDKYMISYECNLFDEIHNRNTTYMRQLRNNGKLPHSIYDHAIRLASGLSILIVSVDGVYQNAVKPVIVTILTSNGDVILGIENYKSLHDAVFIIQTKLSVTTELISSIINSNCVLNNAIVNSHLSDLIILAQIDSIRRVEREFQPVISYSYQDGSWVISSHVKLCYTGYYYDLLQSDKNGKLRLVFNDSKMPLDNDYSNSKMPLDMLITILFRASEYKRYNEYINSVNDRNKYIEERHEKMKHLVTYLSNQCDYLNGRIVADESSTLQIIRHNMVYLYITIMISIISIITCSFGYFR